MGQHNMTAEPKQSDKYKAILANLEKLEIRGQANIQVMYDTMRFLQMEIRAFEEKEKGVTNGDKL